MEPNAAWEGVGGGGMHTGNIPPLTDEAFPEPVWCCSTPSSAEGHVQLEAMPLVLQLVLCLHVPSEAPPRMLQGLRCKVE